MAKFKNPITTGDRYNLKNIGLSQICEIICDCLKYMGQLGTDSVRRR
jgi:hypothetical protein